LARVFIAAGATNIASFSWVFFIFGAFWIWTALEADQEARSDRGEAVRGDGCSGGEKRVPTDRYHGHPAVIVGERQAPDDADARCRSPSHTDVRSRSTRIPAIFGSPRTPYIVFTAKRLRAECPAAAVLPDRRAAEEAGAPVLRRR